MPTLPQPRPDAPPDSAGPAGFCWLVPGRLGGCARPGRSAPLDDDLDRLARMGTTRLATLTAEWAPPTRALARRGMRSLHLPIADFGTPEPAAAAALCEALARELAQGGTVVLHCQAGRGRTGTMLAALAIRHGHGADDALALVRDRNPHWVETPGQEAFLHAFARHLSTDQA